MDGPYERELSAELRAFLHAAIDSLEQLDILLLLRRTRRPWIARDVAAELGIEERVAQHELDALRVRGLLERTAGNGIRYGYNPRSADLERGCALLDDKETASRAIVLAYIGSTGRRAMKWFADAFRFRERK